jgi:hypothetical protein
LQLWAEACGRSLLIDFPLVGGHDHQLVEAITLLDPVGRETLVRWARLWPHLPAPTRKSMELEAYEWERAAREDSGAQVTRKTGA